MAHYKLILAYDGTDFSGFQRQGRERTVQLELEKALTSLGWIDNTIVAAGRTDAGVHASGQVVGFRLNWNHSAETLGKALNAKLPQDIAVINISETNADFHPRYDAISRTYRYQIYFLLNRHPLLHRYSWRVWPPISLDLLKETAQIITGRHDFSAFGTPLRANGTTKRTIIDAGWKETNGILSFEVTANAYLYHMVRRIVFLQVMVAGGRLTVDDLKYALQEGRKLKPGLAPARGLALVNVLYGKAG